MSSNQRPETPGQRIKAIREARGLRQVDVAERAGISQTLLSAIERDETSPTVERAQKIAETLGATIDELWPREAA